MKERRMKTLRLAAVILHVAATLTTAHAQTRRPRHAAPPFVLAALAELEQAPFVSTAGQAR
jgi:hypothetical protein